METLSSDSLLGLLNLARDGDADAFGRLLESHRAYLSLIAGAELDQRIRGKVTASDVVQDTFAHARRGFSEFRGNTEGELTAWLRKILIAQMATSIRHFTAQCRDFRLERGLEEAVNQSSLSLQQCLVDPGTSPSGRATRRESAVLVADALADLPADQREVLVLRHIQKLSFPKIAQRMGRPLENVKSLWRRGLKSLRDLLVEYQ